MDRGEAHINSKEFHVEAKWFEDEIMVVGSANVPRIIDGIYDDFESRTCENCKYWSKQIHMCDNKESFVYRFHATVLKDDGCNKFGRK